jgi:hypothetical protein
MYIGARMLWSLLSFLLAGLASGWMTVRGQWRMLGLANALGSLTFGLFMSACFWMFFGLRSIWKTAVFILVSVAAAVLSIWSGVLVVGPLGDFPRYLPEMCVGGYVGAFLILSAASLLLAPNVRLLRSLAKSSCWAIAGGVLAGIGTTAGPAFHTIRMRLNPGQPDSDVSLLLVWQTGMALVLALMLWTERKHWSSITVPSAPRAPSR